jgi:hypothetical protein
LSVNTSALTWIWMFFLLPKRNPNPDFITSINESIGGATVPIYELILLSIGLSINISAPRGIDNFFKTHMYKSSLKLVMWGLLMAGIAGFINLIFNLEDKNLNSSTISNSIGRCLRHLNESIALSLFLRLKFDKILLKSFAYLVLSVCLFGAIEFVLWALPLESFNIFKYVYDFRGGYRPILLGIAGGLMLNQAWGFILFFGFYANRPFIFWTAACAGSLITLFSYHRSCFWSFLVTLFFVSIKEIRLRRFLLVGVLAAIVGLFFTTSGFGGFKIFNNISTAKGSDYFSFESLGHRFELLEIALVVFADNPVFGVGPGLFANSVVNLMMSGQVPLGNSWVDTLEEQGSLSSVVSGQTIFDAHNIFVSLVVESGVFGWMIIIGYFMFLFEGLLCFNGKRAHTVVFSASWLWVVSWGETQGEPYLFSLVGLIFIIMRHEVVSEAHAEFYGKQWKRKLNS